MSVHQALPPKLPLFILVDFGDNYTGPNFFPENDARKGWVPIPPQTSEWYTQSDVPGMYDTHSRTMIPLRLCWAWTMWKAQGQTIRNKLCLNLTKKEREHGLTYVAFSRATKFLDIGIFDGISRNRLCNAIRNNKKLKPRLDEENRLRQLCAKTLEKI